MRCSGIWAYAYCNELRYALGDLRPTFSARDPRRTSCGYRHAGRRALRAARQRTRRRHAGAHRRQLSRAQETTVALSCCATAATLPVSPVGSKTVGILRRSLQPRPLPPVRAKYRPAASSLPLSIEQALDALIVGNPLDASAEAAVRAKG